MKNWVADCKIRIGTVYTSRNGHICIVSDIWNTFNHAGELVRTRYVTEHTFLGQIVTERDVLEITIRRGLADVVAK